MWQLQAVATLIFFLVLIYEINTCNETIDIFPCTCAFTNGKIVVDCSGNSLRTVPENLPKQMTALDFSDNLLQPDTIESLCKYHPIEHVSVANNHFTSIEPKRLRRCDVNGSIDFSGNPLTIVDKNTLYGLEFTPALHGIEAREFKENTFMDMYGLTDLEMITHQNTIPSNLFKKNRIVRLNLFLTGATEIPEKLVSPLNKTLTDLAITCHSLQILPTNLLHDLKTLEQFSLVVRDLHSISSKLFQTQQLYHSVTNISLNGIRSLPRQIFSQLGRLRFLEIHGTVDMPSDLFDGLLWLEVLDLSECAIKAIPDQWFHDLWHLGTLNLHNTRLSEIKKEDFKDLTELEFLDLSNNQLRTLDPMLFQYISKNAKFINISENILKKVPNNLFKQYSVLEEFDISKNQIYSIESEAFIHLSELKRLHLQSNKIYQLHAATFVYNVNMTYLDISSNILFDLPVGLLGSRHSLLVFNLSDNRISNITRSIAFNGPTLREINFSYNPIECDCGIETVKKLLPNASIIGYCINTPLGIAIVDFPDDNCLLKSDADSFNTSVTFSTDRLYSTGGQTEWESKLIISTNDAVPAKTLNSISPTATTVRTTYPAIEAPALRINSTFPHSKYSSKTTKIPDLPLKIHNVSENDGTVSIRAKFTPTPAHNTSTSEVIKKSTSVKVNESRLDLDDNILDINTNKILTDYLNTVSIKFTKPAESVRYKTDDANLMPGGYVISSEKVSKSEPEINDGTSSGIVQFITLEPSFKSLKSGTSQLDIRISRHSEILQTIPYLSNDASRSDFIEFISPTSVYVEETNDGQTMTDGVHNSSEIFEHYSPNASALPPNIGYGNITNNPEMAENEEKSGYFYLSLGSIIGVAVFSVLILVFLYVKRRRSDEFVIGTRRSANVYEIEDSFNEDDLISPKESLCPMKEVPSIQIETVDDDGNVKLEYYIGPNNPS